MVNLGLRDDTRVRGTGWPSGLSARSSFPHSQGTTARATQYVLLGGGGHFLPLSGSQMGSGKHAASEGSPSKWGGGRHINPAQESKPSADDLKT